MRCIFAALAVAVLFRTTDLRADDLGLKVPPGFKVTLWADQELANDIYAMTLDEHGLVIVSGRGWVKRLIDKKGRGKADTAQVISETTSGAMGLWHDSNGLLLCADGYFKGGSRFFAPLAFGEHGGHAIRKGPDGCFYVIYGNSAQADKIKLDPGSPIKKPDAGGILRFSKDMKKIECVAQGFRNPYDFDFTPLGDIITYDSDTERDVLLPWYSPTRMYHVAHGQHHGWRLPGYIQSLARRDYYSDTVDILWPVGRGSPTGIVCYRHYQFPKRYRGGVFALDWTFGKIYFFPLEADGSTYKTRSEVFLEPNGINGFAPTDACVAPDGSMFVCIGGRGTRGAIYRIEYVGTKKEPREEWKEPEKDIDKMLDAPEPLNAWSRAKWEPIIRRCNSIDLNIILDEKQPVHRRIRAIEIMNDIFSGWPLSRIEKAARSTSWEVRGRVAWSLGRDFPDGGEKTLIELAKDPHPKVRIEALNALDGLLNLMKYVEPDQMVFVIKGDKPFISAIADSLGHSDKRVRMAASQLARRLSGPTWIKLQSAVEKTSLRAQLAFAIADHRPEANPAIFTSHKLATAFEALKSSDPQLRLDALRLLMLIDGDWCLRNPPEIVYSAYALQNPRKKPYDIETPIRAQIRKLYPTGDKIFDAEASRYFAMIEDDDPETVAKIIAQISKGSAATEDVHHLIVLSRLKGMRTSEQTAAVADALLELDRKLHSAQLGNKLTWGPRLAEVVANLAKQHAGLAEAMVKHPAFVRAAHVSFTAPFDPTNRAKAARLFLDAVKKDSDFAWSEELVDLLALLPTADYRPVLRQQWSDYSLRDSMLKHLLIEPDVADRSRFLDGLDSPQKRIVLACIATLEKLPRDDDAKNLVPILRRLRLSVEDPKEKEVRDRLLALFNRQAGTKFVIDTQAPDTLKLKEAYAPVFAWFDGQHPIEAKLLRGNEDDTAFWKKQLVDAPWEKGNAERGVKIFRERSCAVCHTGTSHIGPDLTGVTGRFSRDDLFTSIIYPSRDVAPAYRVNDIETRDGKRFSGIVVFEAAESVIVQLNATETIRIDGGNIASRQPSTKSLMPNGLLKDLKPGDLADLYAYLKTLKSGP